MGAFVEPALVKGLQDDIQILVSIHDNYSSCGVLKA